MARRTVYCSMAIVLALLMSLTSYVAIPSADSALADTAPASAPLIVPLPVSMTMNAGQSFTLSPGTRIVVLPGAHDALPVANYLAGILRPSTGYPLPVSEEAAAEGDIALGLSGDSGLGSEGYQLDVASDGVALQAVTPAGLFYGVQTLRQLLPPWIESASLQPGPWTMPGVSITDYPRYEYRGMHLDIARHFEPPEAVKRLIDEISAFKINVLHLHVSDDQGFRIVINGRPELTDIGSQFSINNDPGGFWTQAEYIDVVNYAAAHFMTIVPEVDSPGHNNAIIMSYNTGPYPPYPIYPDINCSTNHPPVWNLTGAVGYSAMCPESPHTWEILTDIITQLSAMSSSPIYDLGGDEVSSISRDQYNAFVDQESAIVRAQGKAPMGWADISSAGFTPSDDPPGVAQFWSSSSNPGGSGGDTGRVAVAKGMQVVMTPANHAYLDMKYPDNPTSPLGLTWAGRLDISHFYNWSGSTSDPATYIPARDVNTTLFAEAAIGGTNVKVNGVSGFAAGIPLAIDTGANQETVTITEVGTQGRTTALFSAAAIDDTNIKVNSVSGMSAGDTLQVDTGPALEMVTITDVGTQANSTTLFTDALAGDMNIKVSSVSGMSVGDTLLVDTGVNLETVTITDVGTQGRTTNLRADAAVGDTNIKVRRVTGFSVGDTMTVGSGASLDTVIITDVGTQGSTGTGVTFTPGLSFAHAYDEEVRVFGTGVTLESPLAMAHAMGAPVVNPGTGVTFTPAFTMAHAAGAPVIDPGTGISFTPPLAMSHSVGASLTGTLPAVTDDNIIGVEAALWSETLQTIEDIEFMAFPRLPAAAELAWSPVYDATTAPDRTLESFEARIVPRGAAWQAMGVNFYPSPQAAWRVDVSAPDVIQDHLQFDGAVASVAAPGASLADVTAEIDWGDGNTSEGVLSGTEGTNKSINSLYSVSGSHEYAEDGVYDVSVTVSRPDSSATAHFTLVADTTPPEIGVVVSPDMLWPANHKYVTVNAAVTVSDLDPSPVVTLVSVESNEPDNGEDDGDTVNDIVIVDDVTFDLRAERSGAGTGRIYTITYEATDWAGNSSTGSATVTVPLSKGN
jgi:N-acetyl-beta-hexosaminidase